MTRTFTLLLTVVLCCFACWAADNPAVGKWDTKSDDGSGHEQTWTLVVKEDGSKLSGALVGDVGEIPLVDPKLDGNTFTFKFVINAQCTVEAKLKIEGNKFDGKFACPEASGTLKGTKQS